MALYGQGSQQANVMFIFGDGRNGHCLSKVMCKELEKSQQPLINKFTVVVDKKFEQEMKDIQTGKICQIVAVDFSKGQEEALGGIMGKEKYDWLILLAAGDYFTSDKVKGALESYKKCQGKNVALLSKSKFNESNEQAYKEMQQNYQLVKQMYPQNHVVLCCQILLQDLDFFGEDLKKKKAWCLPTGDGIFSPVCLEHDVSQVLYKLCSCKDIKEEYKGQIWNLTNKDKINGQTLAQITNSALQEDVKFENISQQEADDILKRHQQGKQSGQFQQGSQYQQQQGSQYQQQTHRHLYLLSNHERSGLIAAFQMIQNGKYDFVTEDVKKIAQKEPMSIQEYLQEHQDNFKGQ